MKRTWTADQKKAIDLNQRNLLVAAAAGSGKTAVLVERILQKVMNPAHPLDIDRLLVVTFTRAAAAEMKERLRDAISKQAEDEPENSHLKRQLTLLHYADITTIDSFCLQVVRNYGTEIDLDPDFRVGDEGELKLLFSDTMEKFLEEQYRTGEEAFFAFAESYASGKNDRVLEECIEQLYQFSQSYPWPQEWFRECRESFELSGDGSLEALPWLTFLEAQIRLQAAELSALSEQALVLARGEEGPYMYESALLSDLQVQKALAQAEKFSEMVQLLNAYRPERLSGKKDPQVDPELREYVKSVRDTGKKQLQELQKQYGSFSVETILADMEALKSPMQTALSLAEAFGTCYTAAKREKKLLDFNDVEHLALSVLVERKDGKTSPTAAARDLSERYEEIMIDEYQDESRLQEEILTAVSRQAVGTPNMFLVGDVKQSIYKFRLARPELFMEKYERYSTEDSLYQKIDLHKNFRSRKEPLAWINHLFFQIMKKDLGGVEYDETAALYPGAAYPDDEEAGSCYAPELLLVDLAEAEEEFSAEEAGLLEARMIAKRIRALTDPKAGLKVRGEDGSLRPAGFGDIAILVRSGGSRMESLVSTLLDAGIPARAQTKTGYFSAWEVQVALNWLRILDNPCQDIPLASVLRSPAAGFSSEELSKVAAAYQKTEQRVGKPRLYHALCAYQEADSLSEKIKSFLKLLHTLREQAGSLSIHELLQEVFDRTGFYDQVSVMPGGRVRRGNLDMLLEKAIAYEQSSYHGLFQFVRYIDKLEKYQVDFQEAAEMGGQEDQVQIMTIHASKGLEFPVVFVAGLQKKFNETDTRRQMVLHPDWGISADYVDPKLRLRKKTLLKKVYAKKLRTDNLGEELRILYVALTRAREKLILTGAAKNLEKQMSKWNGVRLLSERALPTFYLFSASGYLDWILMGKVRQKEENIQQMVYTPEELVEEAVLRQIKQSVERKQLMEWQEMAPEETIEGLHRVLTYQYPYEAETRLHTKLSVSELKKKWMVEEETEENALAKEVSCGGSEAEEAWQPSLPAFMREQAPLTGASRGTAYHKLLELWDYGAEADLESISAQIGTLSDRAALSKEEADCICPGELLVFLESPIGRRMAAAARKGRLYREKQFVMGIPAAEAEPDCASRELMVVQGIIDAWIEEPDGLVLVDYKTDRVPRQGGEEVLKGRYAAQLRYYEKALSQITGKPVKGRVIYSLYLGKEIQV